MFACRFPKRFYLTNYNEALSLWEGLKPAKGYTDPDWRSLFNRRRENSIVRKDSKGAISFRLYSTDVVTFNPDNTVDLEPVSTQSTRNFVHAILGGGVYALWSDRSYPAPSMLTQVGDMVYHTPDFATLRYDTSLDSPSWTLVAGSRPFTRYRIDRKASNRVCQESGFNQFALWLRTQVRLGLDPRQGCRWYGQSIPMGVISCLDEPDRYHDIVRDWTAYAKVETQLAALRLKVQKSYDAIVEEELEAVPYHEVESLLASIRRLG